MPGANRALDALVPGKRVRLECGLDDALGGRVGGVAGIITSVAIATVASAASPFGITVPHAEQNRLLSGICVLHAGQLIIL